MSHIEKTFLKIYSVTPFPEIEVVFLGTETGSNQIKVLSSEDLGSPHILRERSQREKKEMFFVSLLS